MKKYIYLILPLVLLISCNEWFDITSSSEIRKKDHYKNVQGFQQTLVGCYIGMTDNALYGQTLTWFAPEIMAHQYEGSTVSMLKTFYDHNYKALETSQMLDKTWEYFYKVIVNANDALENLEEHKNSLHPIDYAVLKGEFLAIRAYLHFDLLRLYGYGNWAKRSAELDAKLSIPYVTRLHKDMMPQQTGAELYRLIIKDLVEAAALLQENDPITKKKEAKEYATINADGFYNNRNLHLNYFAVRAIQARVHQWFGTREAMVKALEAASEVINFIENGGFSDQAFKTEIGFISARLLSPTNYSLFKEALFGLNVSKIEDRIKVYIIPDFQSNDPLPFRILPARVEEIYEKTNSDVRFSKLLYQNVSSGSKEYVSIKLVQNNLGFGYKDRISLIRIPEVYYIAAEAQLLIKGEAGVPDALKLINTVRENRGLFTPLRDLNAEKTKEEIRKEYMKEFIGEGVMFFYYKRMGNESIPNLSEDKVMGDEQYVMPFPDFEIQSGRKQ